MHFDSANEYGCSEHHGLRAWIFRPVETQCTRSQMLYPARRGNYTDVRAYGILAPLISFSSPMVPEMACGGPGAT